MSILIKPIITEKATNDSELKSCFTFHVEKDANKVQIKNIIESFYGVKVKKVRTINVRSNSKIDIPSQASSMERLILTRRPSYNYMMVKQLTFMLIRSKKI